MIAEQRITGNAAGGALTNFWASPILLTVPVQQTASSRTSQPVKSVALQTLEFTITDTATPPGGVSTFGFLQGLNIYIESTRPNSTLAKILVANQAGPPGNVNYLGLATYPEENLWPYVQEGAHLTAEATGMAPTHDTTYVGSLTVVVKTL
jgi:hypothetical protein